MMSAADEAIHGCSFQLKNTAIFDAAVEFQPGGVASGFYGRLSRYYGGSKVDELGRWCCDEFQGPRRSVKIYSLYRVNPKPRNAGGSSTAWEQQQLILRTQNIFVDPREQVIQSLLHVIGEDIKRGYGIILMADLNEGIDDREGTNDRFGMIGLENVLQLRYGTIARTYVHGKKAIDHMWMTGDLLPYVSQVGIAPHNYISHSDHRSLMCDIAIEQYLGKKEIWLQSISMRKLNTSIPKRVENYNKTIRNVFKFHKIFDKWNKIKATCNLREITPEMEARINNLDKMISDSMGHAERKSTSITQSILDPWSVKLHLAIQTLNQRHYEKRQSMKCTEDGIFDLERIKACLDRCTEAYTAYREVHENADSYRIQMQNDQAAAHAKKYNVFGPKVKNHVKVIQHMETSSKSFKRIQFTLGKRKGNPLYAVLIPSKSEYNMMSDNDDEVLDVDKIWNRIQVADGADIINWTKIEDRETIINLMLEWQQKHFQQALETPFTANHWETILENATHKENILKGEFEPPYDIPDECKYLLQYMKQRVPECVNSKISFSEYKDYYRKATESTSSSPSGRHYGHYKALLDSNDEILALMHEIMTFCLQHGIILERWKRSVTSLLEKKIGKPYIHKFRTIHVVESELQMFSKLIFAKKMMKAAEKNGVITNDQYGGRARRNALSIVVNKLMYYDICRQTRKPCAFMDDDAKACYDRIVPAL